MSISRPIGSFLLLAVTVVVLAFEQRPACPAEPAEDREHAWRMADSLVRTTNRGVALMERYEYSAAVEAFEKALELEAASVETRVNLAIALYNRSAKGDLERAETLLDQVIGEQPEHLRALYFRGITHQYRGQDDQAVGRFHRVVELAPHDAFAWYLLARSKSRLGRPSRADLERAIAENPALVSAHYELMRVAVLEGKHEEARRHQEQFLRLRESPLADLVVMPQYRKMGPLSLVQPMPTTGNRNVAGGELAAGAARTLLIGLCGKGEPGIGGGLAMADVNGDGHLDLALVGACKDGPLGVALLLGRADQTFTDGTEPSGLGLARRAVSCAFGDYDNDGAVDLFVSCAGPNHLFKGRGDGTFQDVTTRTNTGGADVLTVSAVFLDADHDADLDIYVCNGPSADQDAGAGSNQLLNNNADGTFTDIAATAGVACPGRRSTMLAPADVDGDRDTDLVVFGSDSTGMFFNDRLGKYHEGRITAKPIGAAAGGVVQDFNGDGRSDVLLAPAADTAGRLYLSDGTALLKPSPQFDEAVAALATWGDISWTRVADVDLDGDLDIAVFGEVGHLLLNDGRGRFVLQANLWPKPTAGRTLATELADLTGDGVPDLLRLTRSGGGTIELVPTRLTPPANWVAITPTGDRGADKRTRSPASGFGTRMELRCGLHSQVITYTGLNGGSCQSQAPVVFGLNGATRADYLALTWPDGVTQCENALASRTHCRIKETERRVSSCPVLFAWNGRRFEFVGDFAGVGGLGYYVSPGQYSEPQPLEQVRIEPEQLAARDGVYELRICEPMEEAAYVDRLELIAVDHRADVTVYPDERLAVSGPPPTHELLCIDQPVFPVKAVGPDGLDCAGHLTAVDRVYAYQPALDRRFCGFCKPHALVLDFADRLTVLEQVQGVYLLLTGSIEYPYSQTTFAAAQAGVTWQPLKIEGLSPGGQWETIVPDAGAPGGMGRTIAIDLTGKLPDGDGRLRISTNLEIYYDQIFIAADRGTDGLAIRTVPMIRAELRRLGFPLEYSPDGRHPSIYTYDIIEPTSPFKTPRGAYTRYGRVDELLAEFDDRYVILGSGDEIAVGFDASALPPLAPEQARSFILVSHAYCKDMDLYTAEPDTVEPLPFRGMSAYPYSPGERYPDHEEFRRYHRRFNTRLVP